MYLLFTDLLWWMPFQRFWGVVCFLIELWEFFLNMLSTSLWSDVYLATILSLWFLFLSCCLLNSRSLNRWRTIYQELCCKLVTSYLRNLCFNQSTPPSHLILALHSGQIKFWYQCLKVYMLVGVCFYKNKGIAYVQYWNIIDAHSSHYIKIKCIIIKLESNIWDNIK